MGKKIVIQRKGQTMKEGTIGRWLKKDGDQVRAGEAIYELEYDKATCEIEAPADGTIRILAEEGATLPVGTLIAEILKEGETGSQGMQTQGPEKQEEKEKPALQLQKEPQPVRRIRATPYARKIAALNGVNLEEVTPGTKKNKIVAADVEAYMKRRQNSPESSAVSGGEGVSERMPLSPMRRAIAKNMMQSYFSRPVVTYSMEADCTEILKIRRELNEEYETKGVKVSVNDILLKAAACALKKNPEINVSLEGNDILYHKEINIGMAVAVPGGLVVPVLKNTDRKAFDEVAQETRKFIDRAAAGMLTGDEMTGGTFTVSNLGSRGINMFTPIINGGEAAILGVGAIQEKPVAVNGAVEIRPMMVLSLTADHRLIDGAVAADFLGEVKHILEKPILMFI